MPRFFISSAQVAADQVVFSAAQSRHLAGALRARAGEQVVAVEDGRREVGLVLEQVSDRTTVGRIVWSREATGEAQLNVIVLQAMPAHGAESTIEALAIAGASSIRPVLTRRGVSRPDAARMPQRLERWRVIATEAAQLAGRARAPVLLGLADLEDAVASLSADCRILACMPAAATAVHDVRIEPAQSVALVIGPEGGLAPDETAMLRRRGAELVHLGPRVFPSRLAGCIALSLLLDAAGELDLAATPPPESEE